MRAPQVRLSGCCRVTACSVENGLRTGRCGITWLKSIGDELAAYLQNLTQRPDDNGVKYLPCQETGRRESH